MVMVGLQTLEVVPSTPGKYQTRIRPWRSTSVVGFSNGSKFGVGNRDIKLLSTGAGDKGVPGGMWWAVIRSANNSTSHGTVTGDVKYIKEPNICLDT